MAGIEDSVGLNGYWLAPSPSPRTYFSAMLGEDARARSVMERFGKESILEKKSNLGGGLGERIAARAGFNAPRLNTTSHFSLDSDAKSPYLTVPPGLSPTALLDSPVFLSNSLVQQSPTTGKLPSLTNGNNTSSSSMSDGNMAMAPTTLPGQNFPGPEASVKSESSLRSNCAEPFKRTTKDHEGFAGEEHIPRLDDRRDEGGEQRGSGNCVAPSDDGYNWRKYGQKQVKGSEYPRSYYKCTHQSCQVKKKVERSHEGHITEIIYKGAHSHPRRGDVDEQQQRGEKDLLSTSQQNECAAGAPDRRHEDLEATLSASSTFSNEEGAEDRGTHGSKSMGYDGEGDESESKRRKIEVRGTESSGVSRAVREPRVVVQTTSEVDILDDGYRWRKYGQKVVKGNPNPRSYYKCTSAGCAVRKHVERASHDLKSVITTYEGKHNHAVPAGRNSNHMNAGTSSAAADQASPTVQDHNGMAKFGPPVHGSNPYIMQRRQTNEMGFIHPKGELEGEPMLDAVYHRIMSRLPL